LKICILNVYHDAFDKRMYHKVGRSLMKAGHLVVSICPEGEFAGAERDGIHFRFVPPARGLFQRFVAIAHLARAGWKEQADVYVAPEPESWVAALIVKKLLGGKVVFDMHEHSPSKFARYFPRPLRGAVVAFTCWLMRRLAKFTDHIILTRESFEPLWDGLAVPRTVVINSNHLQPACTEIPASVREQVGPGPAIIHQGLFGDIRGSWQLLDAMKIASRAIPELRCIVLGTYEYGNFETYRRAVADAGLEGTIIFIDAVPYEEVPAYIAASEIGLILFQPGRLNHTLAMPHKLFDYMREGKPVIAPDFAVEVAQILDDAEGGVLLEITDPQAIARAIIHLIRHPERARQLGANGRRAIEERYHWEREEPKLLAAFQSLERD